MRLRDFVAGLTAITLTAALVAVGFAAAAYRVLKES
jgi:hypothetical protein